MSNPRIAGIVLLLLGPVLFVGWIAVAGTVEGRHRTEVIDGQTVYVYVAREGSYAWYELAIPAAVSGVGAVLIAVGSTRRNAG